MLKQLFKLFTTPETRIPPAPAVTAQPATKPTPPAAPPAAAPLSAYAQELQNKAEKALQEREEAARNAAAAGLKAFHEAERQRNAETERHIREARALIAQPGIMANIDQTIEKFVIKNPHAKSGDLTEMLESLLRNCNLYTGIHDNNSIAAFNSAREALIEVFHGRGIKAWKSQHEYTVYYTETRGQYDTEHSCSRPETRPGLAIQWKD